MSDSTPVAPASGVRPLPPRANLEFEHKRAKALLRQLRRGWSSTSRRWNGTPTLLARFKDTIQSFMMALSERGSRSIATGGSGRGASVSARRSPIVSIPPPIDERRREQVTSYQLLDALVERQPGFAADLVAACGGDLSRLRRELARA